LFFVRCSPIQANYLIDKIQNDLPQKQFKTLTLENETENLYDLVANLPEKQNTNILFIRGLENSLLRYEEKESLGLTLSSQSSVYGGTWAGIPRILGHLNLSRERFRESFSIAFVFLLPEFALRYFIRRAPDFFDWRSGVYDFPTDKAFVNSEAIRLVFVEGGDFEKYRTLTPQKQLQRLAEIRAYLSESPDHRLASQLWHEKGLIHTVNKQFEEAITSYDNALKIKSDDPIAWFNRGNALGDLGRNEEAIASYDNALKIKPDYSDAWYNRGIALGNLGRLEELNASHDNALKIKPDYHLAWYNQGITFTERINFYQQEIEKSKNNNNPVLEVLMLKEISDLKKELKDYKTAYKFLFKSWKLAESLRLKISESLFRELQKIYLYPDTFIKLGKLDKANDFIADWLPIFKEANDTNGIDKFVVYEKTIETNLFCNQGNDLLNLGRYEEAITAYDEGLKIKPDDHLAWNNRGSALFNLGRLEEAIASYEQALKFKPDYHDAWFNRGAALGNLGRLEEAIASYDNALNFKPDDPDAWNNRGAALGNLGRNEEEIASYDEALKIKPDDHLAWNNRGLR